MAQAAPAVAGLRRVGQAILSPAFRSYGMPFHVVNNPSKLLPVPDPAIVGFVLPEGHSSSPENPGGFSEAQGLRNDACAGGLGQPARTGVGRSNRASATTQAGDKIACPTRGTGMSVPAEAALTGHRKP